MDCITIKGLDLFAYHGVNPEEKRDGQHFLLDIHMSADLSRARRQAARQAREQRNQYFREQAIEKSIEQSRERQQRKQK